MKNKISEKDKKDWKDFIKNKDKVEDKDNKILSGDPKKIKKVLDTWTFSKEINSTNPNWLLVSTEA